MCLDYEFQVVRNLKTYNTCTIFSDSESRALVASSKIKIEGSFTMALAIAILCFCPPLKVTPRSPRTVSYLDGNPLIKL